MSVSLNCVVLKAALVPSPLLLAVFHYSLYIYIYICREKVLSGSLNCVVLKAALVPSPLLLAVAAIKALLGGPS